MGGTPRPINTLLIVRVFNDGGIRSGVMIQDNVLHRQVNRAIGPRHFEPYRERVAV